MLTKKKIFLITSLLYILYTVFPLFADLTRIPVWLPSMASVVVMVLLYPRAFANRVFYWFLVYALVLVFYLMLGRPLTIGIGSVADSKKIFIEFAFILPAIGIFCILHYLKDEGLTRQLVNWSIGILFVSFIVAIPLMQRYGSLRAALDEEIAEASIAEVSAPGLPGYPLMHAYTLFLPVLCYGMKAFEGAKKWWTLVGLLVLCFVVYDTFVTTSLILMIFIVIFTVFYSDKSNVLFFVVFGIIAIVIYILYKAGVFISLIDWMLPAFEGTPVEYKLNDFKDSMMQGHITGGSITGRMDYHDVSKQAFYNNPIIGSSVAGGHSSILDRLGGMGLVGALPFIMIFVTIFRQIYKLYTTKLAKAFFFVGVVVGVVFLYNKGLFNSEGWLMYAVLMPMGIMVFEQQSSKQKSINNEQ